MAENIMSNNSDNGNRPLRRGGVTYVDSNWQSDVNSASNGHRVGKVTLASDYTMKKVHWGWANGRHERIPIGELTLTAGHGEAGKSTFNLGLIAQLTLGELDGYWYGKPQFCIIAASEDDWERTIIPRLVAAGADLDMIGGLEVITQETPDGEIISLPKDYGELEAAIDKNDASWVFFDSIVGAIDLARDTNHGQHVRDILMKLQSIARRQNCVIIGNVHFNKNNAADAMERMSGSQEFRNVSRAVIYLAMDEDGIGVISKQKNNLGRSWPSIAYRIEEILVDEEQEITAGTIMFLGTTDKDASEIINRKPARKMSGALVDLIDALQAIFKVQKTWKKEDIINQLREAGASTNEATLNKAVDKLGIEKKAVYKKAGKGIDYWEWTVEKSGSKQSPRI